MLQATHVALDISRKAKHEALKATKHTRSQFRTLQDRWNSRGERFNFDPQRYPDHRFLALTSEAEPASEVSRRIFALWTGENEIPGIRRKHLNALASTREIEFELVTPNNLHEWILPEAPLHPAYSHLSLVHRSDYLRAYLLHHHGGGYCDIKAAGSWKNSFKQLEADPNHWVVGYPEDSRGRIPQLGGNLERDLHAHFRFVSGTGALIARAHSPFTEEWLAEVERRLDYFASILKDHPGGVRNEAPSYPVGWTQLLASIVYPLSLKYRKRITLGPQLRPSSVDYR